MRDKIIDLRDISLDMIFEATEMNKILIKCYRDTRRKERELSL